MKHGALREMILLAQELQISKGLTMAEMMAFTERSRRTVERMIQGLFELGIETETAQAEGDHHLLKRWRLTKPLPAPREAAIQRPVAVAIVDRDAAVGRQLGRHRARGQRDDAGQRRDAMDVVDVQRHPDEAGMDLPFRTQHLQRHGDAIQHSAPEGEAALAH